MDVLEEAGERFERRYEMKRLGYDLKTIEERVCEIYNIKKRMFISGAEKRPNLMQEPFIVIGRSKNSDMPKESWPKNWA